MAEGITPNQMDTAALAEIISGLQRPLAEPAAPDVTVNGATGTTVYRYQVVANNAFGSTNAGMFSVTTDGNATLDGTNNNTVDWAAVEGGDSYDVYRSVDGVNEGKINAAPITGLTLLDDGLTGDDEMPPTVNTTAAIQGEIKTAIKYIQHEQILTLPGGHPTSIIIVPAQGSDKIINFINGLYYANTLGGDYANVDPTATMSLRLETGAILSNAILLGDGWVLDVGGGGEATGNMTQRTGTAFQIEAGAGVIESYKNRGLRLVGDTNNGLGNFTGGDPGNYFKIVAHFTMQKI